MWYCRYPNTWGNWKSQHSQLSKVASDFNQTTVTQLFLARCDVNGPTGGWVPEIPETNRRVLQSIVTVVAGPFWSFWWLVTWHSQAMPFARDLGLVSDYAPEPYAELPESRPGDIPIRRCPGRVWTGTGCVGVMMSWYIHGSWIYCIITFVRLCFICCMIMLFETNNSKDFGFPDSINLAVLEPGTCRTLCPPAQGRWRIRVDNEQTVIWRRCLTSLFHDVSTFALVSTSDSCFSCFFNLWKFAQHTQLDSLCRFYPSLPICQCCICLRCFHFNSTSQISQMNWCKWSYSFLITLLFHGCGSGSNSSLWITVTFGFRFAWLPADGLQCFSPALAWESKKYSCL